MSGGLESGDVPHVSSRRAVKRARSPTFVPEDPDLSPPSGSTMRAPVRRAKAEGVAGFQGGRPVAEGEAERSRRLRRAPARHSMGAPRWRLGPSRRGRHAAWPSRPRLVGRLLGAVLAVLGVLVPVSLFLGGTAAAAGAPTVTALSPTRARSSVAPTSRSPAPTSSPGRRRWRSARARRTGSTSPRPPR